jgi:hypothetical protein
MDNDRYLQALRQRSAVMPYGMPVSSDPEASDAYGEGVVRGVAKNLRARAGDFINALRSPMETLGGIVETGKQIVRDPKGSVRAMAQAEALRAANVASGPEAAGEYAASFFDPLRVAGALKAAPQAQTLNWPQPDKIPRGATLQMMSPQDYLKQVNAAQGIDFESAPLPIRKPKTISSIKTALQKGETIETPSLTLQKGKIVDQEGRHRATAAIQAGIQEIPVFVFQRK